MGLLWWLTSTFGSHGFAFALGILAIPGAIVFLFPEVLTIIYRELVVKGILFNGPEYKSASEIPIPDLDGSGEEQKKEENEEKVQPMTGRVSGWLIVRRQYKPSKEGILFTNNITDLTGAQKRRETKDDTASITGSGSIKEKDSASVRSGQTNEGDDDDPRLDADAASTFTTDSGQSNSNKAGAAPSIGSTSTTTSGAQRSWVQAARQTLALPKREAPAKERFYCVLKGSVMYLYEDERQSDALAVLAVDRFRVSVETSSGEFDGKDGEMFAKKNAIVMRLSDGERDKADKGKSMPVLARGMTGEIGHKEADHDMERAPWYLLSKNNSQLEDWYLALVQASAERPTMDEVFSYDDMQDLVKTIDAEQDPIPTRWLNAILGRVFFGLYRTAFVEEFIIGRIMKKLNKVPKPNWLSDISVQEVNIGTFPPFFSKPMLKDLRSDGSITFEAYLKYIARENQPNSKIRLTMAFLATIPVGFKSIQVPVVAAVMVKAMEGNMIFTIKPAPSNRIWYGFTSEPVMDIEISLMGAEWKVESSFILNQLKKFLKQAIAEVLVAPNFDDLAFFDTSKLEVRGGIFSEAGKLNAKPDREEVSLKGAPSQPSVVAKEDAVAGDKKRNSVLSETTSTEDKEKAKIKPIIKAWTDSTSATKGKNGNMAEVASASTSGVARSTSISSSKAVDALASRLPGHKARPNSIHNDHSVIPGTGEASASAPNLVSIDKGNTVTSSPASDRPLSVTSGFHPFPLPRPASVQSNETQSTQSSASTATGVAGVQVGTDAHLELEGSTDRSVSPNNAAAGSLLDSFRARDKQAIAAQVNTAKSAVRKWGLDFAAKRRADFQQTPAPAATQPASPTKAGLKSTPHQTSLNPTYRPEETHSHTASTSLGHSPGRSLQERLNDAARAAANVSSSSGATGNRERSASNLSNTSTASASASVRPTLLSSPSKAVAVDPTPSISEPNFTLSAHRTGEREQNTPRRESASTTPPVLMQPSAGRSMVVPRVRHRPGEVIGLGSSPDSGLTRKMSASSEVALGSSSGAGGSRLASPPTPVNKGSMPSHAPTGLPKDSLGKMPSVPDLEDGAPMQRSGSAPAPITSEKEAVKPDTQIVGLTRPDEDDIPTKREEGAPETPVGEIHASTSGTSTPTRMIAESTGAGGAQDALRRLADKDGQSRKDQSGQDAASLAE